MAEEVAVNRRVWGGMVVLGLLGVGAWVSLRPNAPAEAVPRQGRVRGKGPRTAEEGKALTDPHKLRKTAMAFRREVGHRPEAPPGAPNLVVVLGCTLRRDQLSPYGGPAEVSPWLDAMARDGVVFEDVVAASSWTMESSTAIFTGRPAISVGMVEPADHHSVRVLSERVDTLAERLAARGWYTLGVTANPHLNTDFGLAQGFDHYRDTQSAGFAKRNRVHGADAVASALAMLDDRGDEADRPFYLRLVLIDAHVPLMVEPAEVARFTAPGVPDRLATYRAGVRRVDDALAALASGLRARGYDADDTLFVMVTDHGEGLNLPEHHRDQHGRVLYPTITSVPWIVQGPGVARGVRVEGLASHLDVQPTILGLLGLTGHDLPGEDLSEWVRSGGRTRRTRAFTETWYFGANRSAILTEERACQKDWGSTRIQDDVFEDGCFDRRRDPDWRTPFVDAALTAELTAWRAARRAEYDAWPDTRDVSENDDVSRQLEALGYVEAPASEGRE